MADRRVVPEDHPDVVVAADPETGEDVILVAFSTLNLCEACVAGDHTHHQQNLDDGVQCPCKGECNDSLVWPSRSPRI